MEDFLSRCEYNGEDRPVAIAIAIGVVVVTRTMSFDFDFLSLSGRLDPVNCNEKKEEHNIIYQRLLSIVVASICFERRDAPAQDVGDV